jgi:hypothetical protein
MHVCLVCVSCVVSDRPSPAGARRPSSRYVCCNACQDTGAPPLPRSQPSHPPHALSPCTYPPPTQRLVDAWWPYPQLVLGISLTLAVFCLLLRKNALLSAAVSLVILVAVWEITIYQVCVRASVRACACAYLCVSAPPPSPIAYPPPSTPSPPCVAWPAPLVAPPPRGRDAGVDGGEPRPTGAPVAQAKQGKAQSGFKVRGVAWRGWGALPSPPFHSRAAHLYMHTSMLPTHPPPLNLSLYVCVYASAYSST